MNYIQNNVLNVIYKLKKEQMKDRTILNMSYLLQMPVVPGSDLDPYTVYPAFVLLGQWYSVFFFSPTPRCNFSSTLYPQS
jgi:hypothetical protein